MSKLNISAGNVPDEINAIIEIPANSPPVKYEVDRKTNVLFVDRFISAPMFYPCNYGFIPNTLSADGDPVDVLVITPYPLVHNCAIKCRPVGILKMSDEAGEDSKIITVPCDNLSTEYRHIQDINQLSQLLKDQIEHFFTHYKSLEAGKWVKIEGWHGADAAKTEIIADVNRFNKKYNH